MNSLDVCVVRKLSCPWEALNAFLETGLKCLARFLRSLDSNPHILHSGVSNKSALETMWKIIWKLWP